MQVFSAEVNRVFDPIKDELRIIFTAAKFDIIIWITMKYAVSMRTLYGITGYNFTKSIFSVAIL